MNVEIIDHSQDMTINRLLFGAVVVSTDLINNEIHLADGTTLTVLPTESDSTDTTENFEGGFRVNYLNITDGRRILRAYADHVNMEDRTPEQAIYGDDELYVIRAFPEGADPIILLQVANTAGSASGFRIRVDRP